MFLRDGTGIGGAADGSTAAGLSREPTVYGHDREHANV
jgi:hypothetical protein